LVQQYAADSCLPKTELFSNGFLAHSSSPSQLTDLLSERHIGFAEAWQGVISLSAFRVSISDVRGVVTQEKVVRPYARPHVAAM
jgi:hypothetical protein